MPKLTNTPGVREIKLKSGSVWELRITRKSGVKYSKRYSTKKQAQAGRRKWLANEDAGKSPINRKAEKLTLAHAIASYREINSSVVNGVTISTIPKPEGYRLNMLENDIGKLPMSALKSKAIDIYIALKLSEPVPPPHNKKNQNPIDSEEPIRLRSGATVRKLYYTLKKVAKKHAKLNEYLLPDGAFEDQNVPGGWENERERRIEPGEEEKILKAIEKSYVNHKEWRSLILFALESGLRAQELLKMCWSDLNYEHHFLRIRKQIVKTKTARQIPLSDRAIEILAAHKATKREDDDRIFWQWNDSNVLGHGFKVITKNANLTQRLTIHDLRHEAISRLFERTELSTMEIAAITGHRDLKTLKRYTHLRPELLASRMNGKKGTQVEVPVDEFMAFLKWQEKERAKK